MAARSAIDREHTGRSKKGVAAPTYTQSEPSGHRTRTPAAKARQPNVTMEEAKVCRENKGEGSFRK